MHGANVESRRARSARVLLGWPHTGRRGPADATRKGFLAFVAPWFAPRCLAQRWGWPSLHRGLPPDVWPGGGRGLHCTLACPPHVFPVTCYGPMDWALEAQRARRRSSGYRDGPRGQDGPWWPQGGRTGPQVSFRWSKHFSLLAFLAFGAPKLHSLEGQKIAPTRPTGFQGSPATAHEAS